MSTLLEDAVKGKLLVPSKRSKASHSSKTARELQVTSGQVDIKPDPKVTSGDHTRTNRNLWERGTPRSRM